MAKHAKHVYKIQVNIDDAAPLLFDMVAASSLVANKKIETLLKRQGVDVSTDRQITFKVLDIDLNF